MEKLNKSILFLGKKDDQHCEKALEFCQRNFERVKVYMGKQGDKKPDDWLQWEGDIIISYLCRWILPGEVLTKAKQCAINFHPATPDYPGIGCNNFALYHHKEVYGATCHFMLPKVDTGDIIKVARFKVMPNDDVASILSRTYDYQLVLFYDVINTLLSGEKLQPSGEQWTRKPYTRKDLIELMTITPEMDKQEIEARIRATSFGGYQPAVHLHGYAFYFNPDQP